MAPEDTASSAVRVKLAKADKFLTVAEVAVSTDHRDAAVSLAVSAGVNYSDALCLYRLGRRAAGSSHDDVFEMLRKCGGVGDAVARHHRRLLKNKSKAQYSTQECSAQEAKDAVQHAGRIGSLVHKEISKEWD